jgi:alpha/beta superfamily hydrolase
MLEVLAGSFALNEIVEIRSGIELPSVREDITLTTSDGLELVGELAMPVGRPPVATLITLHPLPTHGGFMDSHVIRKAANRLPELADLAVLRFNTRGTESPRGKSQGEFGDGIAEAADVKAALDFAVSRGLPHIWLVGWSFGTELAIKYGFDAPIDGVILLSPPLRRSKDEDLQRWIGNPRRMIALVPDHDDYLKPAEAVVRFALVPHAQVIGVDEAKHLWVGESPTSRVLNEIVATVNPAKAPLPTTWQG